MPEETSGARITEVRVLKQHWSAGQIAAALAHHDLPEGADLTPEHFAQAGIDTPEGGAEVHTFTFTEGPQG